MKKKQFEVRTYYEAIECKCGGTLRERVGFSPISTTAKKSRFKCDKCGRLEWLNKEDWPGIKHEIIEE